ncbi:MAG: hypothetical protein J7647_16750 [Cyanobacteria bacterium SBLK]|nr:hypothetical protein [Cyanobacteria bacterium SBLK]
MNTFKIAHPEALVSPVANISRSDRWMLYRRLQELTIPCWCLPDGSLWVGIRHGLQALLLRSTVLQSVATRQESIDWLERCWETQLQLSHPVE